MSSEQIETNKKIVERFFTAQISGAADAFKDCAENIAFWISGEKSSHPSAIAGRWQGPEQILELHRRVGSVMEKMVGMEIKHMTAEGDRVAVEAEGFISIKGGAIYNNLYHFLFFVRDGKIQEIKEYLDTALVNETFGLASVPQAPPA